MGAEPRLVVVILNFRTPQVTIDCLQTLAAEWRQWPHFRVVLLDNASGDDSVPQIRNAMDAGGWREWLDFRASEKNLGFAGGNNLIMRECLSAESVPDYVLLLNSDTLVRPGCLAYCAAVMDREPDIGAMSCMLLNRDGSVQNVCRKFPRPDRETVRAMGLPWMAPGLFGWADTEDLTWDRRSGPRDVEWIGGAFLWARSSALARAGLFDEEFFFYGEDCELCHRVWRGGFRVHFDPGAETVHLGGASSDGQRMRNRTKEILTWRARFLVQEKCYGKLAALWIRGVYAAVFALRLGLHVARGRRRSDPDKFEQLREGWSQVTGPLEV